MENARYLAIGVGDYLLFLAENVRSVLRTNYRLWYHVGSASPGYAEAGKEVDEEFQGLDRWCLGIGPPGKALR